MSFQSVPNCAEADIIFSANNVIVQNSVKFTFVGGGYDQSNIDDLAVAIDDWVSTSYLPIVSNQVSYLRTEVRGLEDEFDFFALEDAGAALGGQSFAPLPNNVTFAVKFGSGLTGRSARGRAYMIGLYTAVPGTDENFAVDGYAAGAVAVWEALPTALVGTGWTHVIVSRFHDGAPRTTGIFFPVTTYSFVDKRLDSQRGRLP